MIDHEHYHLSLGFFPVGQGLFAAGRFSNFVEKRPSELNWVFDCGTTSSQRFLDRSLDRQFPLGVRHKIDLMAISHFDRDHISGVARLLGRARVEKLLLPYVPLAQRLVLAQAAGADTNAVRFLFNPLDYLLAQDFDIGEIVMVPPGNGRTPDPEDDGDEDHADMDRNEPPETSALFREVIAARRARQGNFTPIGMLKPQGRLTYRIGFEFVPYNDAELLPRLSRKFTRKVEGRRDALLAATTSAERTKHLNELQKEYDETIGKSSKLRNLISLFLYASPRPAQRSAMLFTGDGFLNNRQRLGALATYLGKRRMENIGCLQVMHHGSRRNWFPGVTRVIQPDISVFSSDPLNRKLHHPDIEVENAFKRFGPQQVNRDHGLQCEWYTCQYPAWNAVRYREPTLK
jgi:beta-lactamase superfamily II metal-dependent hydrolase